MGGWSVGGALFSNMVKDRESRKSFITSVATFLTRYKFDGLDLDWQYPGSTEHQGNYQDKENFAKLIKVRSIRPANRYFSMQTCYLFLQDSQIQLT